MRWKKVSRVVTSISLLMSMKNQAYNPMCEEGYDTKIPLHADEEFEEGIEFKIKFIGSAEVPKPASRAEIVTTMRRIRYEFKARSVRKRSVNLSVSVDGIKVCLCKKNKKNPYFDPNRHILMQHPIYRVFYVSHDSQDLKIFSFIARDSNTNGFRCNVFKAYKKNEAIHIVRTIGQAFEVCHKFSQQQPSQNPPAETRVLNNSNSLEKSERYLQSVQPSLSTGNEETSLFQTHSSSEFTLKHQMQFMQEQFQQMQNELEVAMNQIKLIKEQLNIEIAARIDAQHKNKQLIDRNRELLTHIQQLLVYTHELEMKLSQHFEPFKNISSRPTNLLLLPSLSAALTGSTSAAGTAHQTDLPSDSPDSGKGKEISSESISEALLSSIHEQQTSNSWNGNGNNKTNFSSILDDLTTQTISINEPTRKNSERNSSTSTSCSSINQNPIEHYLYDHILPNGPSAFTNSAFTESPSRTMKK